MVFVRLVIFNTCVLNLSFFDQSRLDFVPRRPGRGGKPRQARPANSVGFVVVSLELSAFACRSPQGVPGGTASDVSKVPDLRVHILCAQQDYVPVCA